MAMCAACGGTGQPCCEVKGSDSGCAAGLHCNGGGMGQHCGP
jgi:hypothetical protein